MVPRAFQVWEDNKQSCLTVQLRNVVLRSLFSFFFCFGNSKHGLHICDKPRDKSAVAIEKLEDMRKS